MSKISVSRDDEVHRKVDITLKDPDKEVKARNIYKISFMICNKFIFRICC